MLVREWIARGSRSSWERQSPANMAESVYIKVGNTAEQWH